MADDVSNKTLAIIVFVAIVVSLGGSWLLIDKVNDLASPFTKVTGAVTGRTRVNVTPVVSIRLAVDTVDFGAAFQNSTNDTTDNIPAPLLIENDGAVIVNVSVNGSVLFTGTGGGINTETFQVKADASGSEPGAFNTTESQTTFRNVTASRIEDFVARLRFTDAADVAETDVKIRIPIDEGAGSKESLMEFVAELS